MKESPGKSSDVGFLRGPSCTLTSEPLGIEIGKPFLTYIILLDLSTNHPYG